MLNPPTTSNFVAAMAGNESLVVGTTQKKTPKILINSPFLLPILWAKGQLQQTGNMGEILRWAAGLKPEILTIFVMKRHKKKRENRFEMESH